MLWSFETQKTSRGQGWLNGGERTNKKPEAVRAGVRVSFLISRECGAVPCCADADGGE